jgi:hypothetical protein
MTMKKFVMTMALLLSFVIGINAQTTALESQKIIDNIYIGVEGGVVTSMDFNSIFPVNAVAGVKLGKEFSPVFAAEVEDFVTFGDNHFMDGKNFVKTNTVSINGKVNFSNLLFGYKGTPRKFELSTNTGIGWQHRYGDVNIDGTYGHEDDDELIAKTGLDLGFNLNAANSLVLSPVVYWNMTNGSRDAIHFNKKFAQLGLTLGYIYHFNTSNKTHAFKMYDIDAYENTIAKLNEELAKKPREVVREVEKIVKVSNQNIIWIPFAFNKSELSEESKNILDNVNVKAVSIDGYASWEDGSNAEHNMNLSVDRANAVASYLKDRGININSSNGHGAENVTSQRCVIITLEK